MKCLEGTYMFNISKIFFQKKLVSLVLLLGLLFISFQFLPINAASEDEVSNMKIESRLVFDTIPLNLEEITEAASRIFVGKCTKIEKVDKPVSAYKYTFKIIEPIKGVKTKKLSFKQWKPTARNNGYKKGKKYILFLHADSKLGLTSPAGFLQGRFEVQRKGFIRRKEVVTNQLHNKGLIRNLRTNKTVTIKSNKYLNDYIKKCSELGVPMRYKEFVEAVRYLVNKK